MRVTIFLALILQTWKLNNLQKAIEKLFQWFSANSLVANADEFHLLTYSKTAIDICKMGFFWLFAREYYKNLAVFCILSVKFYCAKTYCEV